MVEITKRHEQKYIISNSDYTVISRKLNHLLKKDKYSLEHPYIITSLYYDDIQNSALKQKVDGDAYRYKYRIRYYNKSHNLFKLEKKEKIHTITNKESYILNKDEVASIVDGNYSVLLNKDSTLCFEFYQQLKKGLLRPKVIVEYERLAFVHSVGNLRITFDSNIKASLNKCDIFEDSILLTKVLEPHELVMEVKFNGELPYYLKSILQLSTNTQTSMSKYVHSRKYNYTK